MTYTPGPWHISSTHSGKSWNVGARDCTNVCIVHGPEENGPDEYTANARLIAAAPAMLEALNNAIKSLETDGYSSAVASLNTHGRAAIALATEESK